MTASSFSVLTLDLTDRAGVDPSTAQIPSNISFALSINSVQTLWANAEQGDGIEGLLYVPEIDPSLKSSCSPPSIVPANVTRRADLPLSLNGPFVAFAPWINGSCAQAYLAAAQAGPSAFVFFLPNNLTYTPPPVTATVWNLNGPGTWSGLNNLPIYAIPGAVGLQVMDQLSQYSGPLSSAPMAEQLRSQYGSSDYIRLYARLNTGSGSHYPTLWAFLLIVLGVVLVLLAVTSLSMQWKQRRNRVLLQRRIAAGEVDMEVLGVKKPQRMSQADVDALPQVTYVPSDKIPIAPVSSQSEAPGAKTPSPYHYDQPTCPICLEDYVASETKVRCLPCQHIYHPECIDSHLLSSRSLCPVCKARVPTVAEVAQTNTPIGLTEVTNAMVRRERYIRRIRARETSQSAVESPAEWFQRRFRRPLLPTVGVRAANRRQSRLVEQASPSNIEMASPAPAPETVPLPSSPTRPTSFIRPPERNTEARREWARRRASTMLHRHSQVNGGQTDVMAVVTEADESRESMPAWRRGLTTVFPGFR